MHRVCSDNKLLYPLLPALLQNSETGAFYYQSEKYYTVLHTDIRDKGHLHIRLIVLMPIILHKELKCSQLTTCR
jgi:hypothetical protein